MPWIPIKDALRREREAAGYTTYLLANRVGMSDRQIRKIESENPPGSVFGSNVYALASALGVPKEKLFTWVPRKPKPSTPEAKPRRTRKLDAGPRTLEELAELERESRLSGATLSPHVETSEGPLEMLGAERAIECHTQYGAFDGERFLVTGMVDQHKPMPIEAAKLLGTQAGMGGRFQIGRLLFYGALFQVTVFCPTAELTRQLINVHRDREQTNVLVRFMVARSKGRWKGFVGLEKDARPMPYGLIVEKILHDVPDPWEQDSEKVLP
jgi:transcriptional regulator with XRE-family HTH domain